MQERFTDWQYDIVWFHPSQEQRAIRALNPLSETEIVLRGLFGAHGLVIKTVAPMPNEYGDVAGDGAMIMRNFIGSAALYKYLGATKQHENGRKDTVAICEYCRQIDVLRRDFDGKPVLVGAKLKANLIYTLSDGSYSSCDTAIMAEMPKQAEREQDAISKGAAVDMTRNELLVLRIGQLLRGVPSRLLLHRSRLANIAGIVLAIPSIACGWYLRRKAERRQDEQIKKLREPWSPLAYASGVLGAFSKGK